MPDPIPKNPRDFKVGVTHGIRGWFAVLYETFECGFQEPVNTGIGSYASSEKAKPEAREWAEAEGISVDF